MSPPRTSPPFLLTILSCSLLLLLSPPPTSCFSATFPLRPASYKCISERLTVDTLTVLTVNGSTPFTLLVFGDTQSKRSRIPRGASTLITRFWSRHMEAPHHVEGEVFRGTDNTSYTTAFHAPFTAQFHICFFTKDTPTLVTIDLRWGVAANDFSSVLKVRDIQDLTSSVNNSLVELTKYKENMMSLHSREDALRSSIENTSFRIICFGILNIIVMVAAAVMQAIYFRNFFRAKKLI